MDIVYLHVQGNGLFVFDPHVLCKRYGSIANGTNLLDRYTQSDEGENVIRDGALLPIFNIHSSEYKLVVCDENEACDEEKHVWKTNGRYPLISKGHLCVSAMDILANWNNHKIDLLEPLNIESGFLSFEVGLFVRRDHLGTVVSYGYLLRYRKESALIGLTADLEESMVL